MSTVLGIDPSTCTGLVALKRLSPNAWVQLCTTVEFKKATGWNRLQLIAVRIGEFIAGEHPDAAVIEGYAMHAVGRRSTLIEIGTVIRQKLYDVGIPWYVVPPSSLKQYATGNGNAKKSDVKQAVKARWGFTSESDDVVDAYVLARMGHVILTNEQEGARSLKGVHCEYHPVSQERL